MQILYMHKILERVSKFSFTILFTMFTIVVSSGYAAV